MKAKELSAQLVPDVFVRQSIPRPKQTQDRVALVIATCGVGYIPLIPATWASAVTAGVYWILLRSPLLQLRPSWLSPELFRLNCLGLAIITFTVLGIWAATRVEKLIGRKDPKPVVVDEVVGQLVTFILVPYSASLVVIVIAFFMFRACDILKPYPARRLEHLRGGFGVMADDILAGAYGAVLMGLIVWAM